MVVLQVPAVDDPDFIAELTFVDGALLRLRGSADSAVAADLPAMLARVDGELRGRPATELVLDLSAVDAMTAACWRELVAWVAASAHRLRVRANPAIAWQQHVVPALACFATDRVVVEV